VTLAEHLAESILLPGAGQVLARLHAERDNVRAALARAEAAGETGLGLRLARAMTNYWVVRGHLREGRHWLERALGWDTPTASAERAWALVGLSWLIRLQGDLDRAEAVATEALRVAVAAGARMTAARVRHALAAVYFWSMAVTRAVPISM
jgi:non-specific serine/threonine protein kinase